MDLDLGLTMPNIELVQAILIYYNMFKFQFLVIAQEHTAAHTDSDEYPIVAFTKKNSSYQLVTLIIKT